MEVVPDGMRSWVLFTEPAAFMAAELEARHSMGGMKGADPKFTERVLVPGYKEALPFDFAFRRALKVQTPKAQQGAGDLPVTYDLPLATAVPEWVPAFRRSTDFALRTICSYKPGKFLQKEGAKFKEVEFAYCAEHYVKRSFPDMYNLVLSTAGLTSRPPTEWTEAQRAAMSEALAAKLSEPDENGARKFKSILNNKDGAYMGIMNFKNGAPVCDRAGAPLPQTRLFEAVGSAEVERTPAEFLRDTTHGENAGNAAPCMFDMDVRVGQKHVFVVGGKFITDSWNLKEVTYKKAVVGVVVRPRSVLCDAAPPPPPPPEEPLHHQPPVVVVASVPVATAAQPENVAQAPPARGASPVRDRDRTALPERERDRERERPAEPTLAAEPEDDEDFSM